MDAKDFTDLIGRIKVEQSHLKNAVEKTEKFLTSCYIVDREMGSVSLNEKLEEYRPELKKLESDLIELTKECTDCLESFKK